MIKFIYSIILRYCHFIFINNNSKQIFHKTNKTLKKNLINYHVIVEKCHFKKIDEKINHFKIDDHVIVEKCRFNKTKKNQNTSKSTNISLSKNFVLMKSTKMRLIIILSSTKNASSNESKKINENVDKLKLNSTYVEFEINFVFVDFFIYHTKNDNVRFCVSKNCVQNVLRITHDENYHAKHHRVYARLMKTIYIRKLSKRLIIYIRHCSQCQLNQIKKHKSYDELMFIFTLIISYHIIVINFIIILSKQTHDCDVMMIIICKFFKKNILIFEKTTFIVKQ